MIPQKKENTEKSIVFFWYLFYNKNWQSTKHNRQRNRSVHLPKPYSLLRKGGIFLWQIKNYCVFYLNTNSIIPQLNR